MRLRNWRLTVVLVATLTSAACGGANLETSSVPTGNAGDTVDETTTAPQQIDETAADSTTSEPVTAEVSDETTTTETPTPSPSTVPARDEIDPETGAPQALINNLNERGISIDEYLEWLQARFTSTLAVSGSTCRGRRPEDDRPPSRARLVGAHSPLYRSPGSIEFLSASRRRSPSMSTDSQSG